MTQQEEIASFYRQISVNGANPAGMVLRLYDRILEDFRRASEANAAGNIERRVASLNHALLIIAELEGVLDFERGGLVARQLRGFYRVARSLIVEANVRPTPQSIQRLTDLFVPLRQAWQKVEEDVAQNKVSLPEEPTRDLRRQSIASQPEAETSSSWWSA